MIPLEVTLPGGKVETGYGVGWEHKKQNLEYFMELAVRANYSVVDEWKSKEIFYLCLAKQ